MIGFLTWWDAVWGVWHTPIRILAILVAAALVRSLLLLSVKRIVHTVISGMNGKAAKAAGLVAYARVVQRARTLGSVLTNFFTWTVVLVALSAILSELGVAVGALVAGAGILGAALGFGAQSLVRDLISGLFIVFEDQYGVGDSVDLGQATGVVESVGLRVTQVRDVAGVLWYVRNGEVVRVGNQSQGWSRVVLDIPIAYAAPVDKARSAILKAAQSLAEDKAFKAQLMGEPEVWGIELLSGEQVVLRLVQQVGPSHADDIARELRLRIKSALDSSKISMANTKTPIHVEVSGKAVK
ncbi:MAG: mechanosensitive ion channel family protein [Rhodoluna sp.]